MPRRDGVRRPRFSLLIVTASVLFAVLLIVLASLSSPASMASRVFGSWRLSIGSPPPAPTGACYGPLLMRGCHESVTFEECARTKRADEYIWRPGQTCPPAEPCNRFGGALFNSSELEPVQCSYNRDALVLQERCLDTLREEATSWCERAPIPCRAKILPGSETAYVWLETAGNRVSPTPDVDGMCSTECSLVHWCTAA